MWHYRPPLQQSIKKKMMDKKTKNRWRIEDVFVCGERQGLHRCARISLNGKVTFCIGVDIPYTVFVEVSSISIEGKIVGS